MGARKTANSRLGFTKTRLEGLPVPDKGRQYHYDSKVPGLCVCVTYNGTKTFYSYRWANGRPTRICIGRFPDVTPPARTRASAPLRPRRRPTGSWATSVDTVVAREFDLEPKSVPQNLAPEFDGERDEKADAGFTFLPETSGHDSESLLASLVSHLELGVDDLALQAGNFADPARSIPLLGGSFSSQLGDLVSSVLQFDTPEIDSDVADYLTQRGYQLVSSTSLGEMLDPFRQPLVNRSFTDASCSFLKFSNDFPRRFLETQLVIKRREVVGIELFIARERLNGPTRFRHAN